MHIDERLSASLDKRIAEKTFRSLTLKSGLIDFSSNDYLGFARSAELEKLVSELEIVNVKHSTQVGSTGSRLLSGNTAFAEELENFIAHYHHAEAALLFNSGYNANLGLFSALGRKGDTIIYDELIHASVHDGMRLSKAEYKPFAHNNTVQLEQLLKETTGQVFVAVESVYSMDGDFAPLKEIAALCKKYKASLIVDEAHATGIFGEKGKGLVTELGLEKDVFARLITYGKAMGCHGAAVVGSTLLKNYLTNFARSFIYTTAAPLHNLYAIKSAYDLLEKSGNRIDSLNSIIRFFRSRIKTIGEINLHESSSPVQSIIIPGNEKVRKAAAQIQEKGFDVRPLVSPTVPAGQERIRICLHAFNTEKEVDDLVSAIQTSL
ncbi:MAG: 8-amino-7-oxononanoate synthase [Bacteroidia bacterium]|nr:8-amino-7-oxononanoate synthase [Bacteroidia bacterium]